MFGLGALFSGRKKRNKAQSLLSADDAAFHDLAEIEWDGARYLLPRSDFTYRDLKGGGYEPWVYQPLMSRLEEGMTFLDVGANLGLFSVQAARRVGPRGRVIAVEVIKRNCDLISRNVALNRLTNVDIIAVGASDHHGQKIAIGKIDSSNATLCEEANSTRHQPQFRRGTFPVAPLDDLVKGYSRIDVLKIDIEGQEYPALRGASNILAAHRPIVFSEYSPVIHKRISGTEGEAYLKLLFDLDYGCCILLRHRPILDLTKESAVQALRRIDHEWHYHVDGEGGTHLDLMFLPGRA